MNKITIRKIIGVIMILTPFIATFAFGCFSVGLMEISCVFAGILLLWAFIFKGIELVIK